MGKWNKDKKKTLVDNKRSFYLTFFDKIEGYEEKEVKGWWLVKMWDGNRSMWTVNLYSKESMSNLKRGQQKYQEKQSNLLDEGFLNAINKED